MYFYTLISEKYSKNSGTYSFYTNWQFMYRLLLDAAKGGTASRLVHKGKSSKRSFEVKKKIYYKDFWHCSRPNYYK